MRKFNRFVVAYDKFKDCLKANQLCEITRKALQSSLGNNKLKVSSIPLADGGDGFLDCIEESYNSARKQNSSKHPLFSYDLKKISLKATGPLGYPVDVLCL